MGPARTPQASKVVNIQESPLETQGVAMWLMQLKRKVWDRVPSSLCCGHRITKYAVKTQSDEMCC